MGGGSHNIQTASVRGRDGKQADVITTNGHNGLVAIAPGHVSIKNSTVVPLVADAMFPGDWEEVTNFGVIVISVVSDVVSATDGLMVEFSSDGTPGGIITDDVYTIAAGAKKTFSFQAAAKFYRIMYTNGGTDQATFNMQTVLKPYYVKPSSHRIQDPIVNDDDAELVKAVLTGENPSNVFINFQATQSGNFKTSVEEIEPETIANFDTDLAIARGLVPGVSGVNKFGRAIEGIQLTPTDIWDRADAVPTQQIWLAPTAARIHAIVSSDDSDGKTGSPTSVGARTIEVFGLKTWDIAETSEIVTLDGTTPVNTVESYVIIHRMKVLTHGTSGPNVGIIKATAVAPDSTVTAQINAAAGQTAMSIYGIPSTQIGYLTNYKVDTHNFANPAVAIETDFTMLINESPDVDASSAGFLIKSNVGTITIGTSAPPERVYKPYLPISGPAIIKFQAISTTADTEAVVEYDLKLVDN